MGLFDRLFKTSEPESRYEKLKTLLYNDEDISGNQEEILNLAKEHHDLYKGIILRINSAFKNYHDQLKIDLQEQFNNVNEDELQVLPFSKTLYNLIMYQEPVASKELIYYFVDKYNGCDLHYRSEFLDFYKNKREIMEHLIKSGCRMPYEIYDLGDERYNDLLITYSSKHFDADDLCRIICNGGWNNATLKQDLFGKRDYSDYLLHIARNYEKLENLEEFMECFLDYAHGTSEKYLLQFFDIFSIHYPGDFTKFYADIEQAAVMDNFSILPDEIVKYIIDENDIDTLELVVRFIKDETLLKYYSNEIISKYIYYNRYNDLLKDIPYESIKQEYKDDIDFITRTNDFSISAMRTLIQNGSREVKLEFLKKTQLPFEILYTLMNDSDDKISMLAKSAYDADRFIGTEIYVNRARDGLLKLDEMQNLLDLNNEEVVIALCQNRYLGKAEIELIRPYINEFEFYDLRAIIHEYKLNEDMTREIAKILLRINSEQGFGTEEIVRYFPDWLKEEYR